MGNASGICPLFGVGGAYCGEAGESRAWEMSVISSGICPLFGGEAWWGMGHNGGEAGESRAWEMSVISSGICGEALFGVVGA